MKLRRLMRIKRFSRENIFLFILFGIAFIVYLAKLRYSRSLSSWHLPSSSLKNEWLVNTNLLWESRVRKICQNNLSILYKNIDKKPFYVDRDLQDVKSLNLVGVVRNKQDKYVRDIGYKHHAFNALVSNNIGPIRDLPDTRHKVCRNTAHKQLNNMPTASVVMCFYNEHKMTLIRSLKSVLTRTPTNLLKEIILVDDFSDLPELEFHLLADLHSQLQYELRYIRNEKREGLIRSRVIGSREALGDVIVFLDSHVEVNNQWLEPLISLVSEENSTLAVPVIDLINPDTFEYTSSPLVRGGFNWGLHYKWENLPAGTLKNESDFKGPFCSPTMAGGLFAVNRQYFKYIGEYDLGMDIWGGENLELSFRVWQCGGAIKIVPCSRVGHIFRKRRPYSSPDGSNTMLKNSMRLANVWMDNYKQYYLNQETVPKNFDYGNISDRIDLRKRLNCKSFEWYLKNIYPEMRLPGEKREITAAAPVFQPWHLRKRNYIFSYLIRLTGTNFCASVVGQKVKGLWKKGSSLTLQSCSLAKNQIWFETDKSEIIIDKLLCLEATGDTDVRINKCHEMFGDQQWRHTRNERSPIYNMATGTCLRAENLQLGSNILLDLCTKQDANAWDIVPMQEIQHKELVNLNS